MELAAAMAHEPVPADSRVKKPKAVKAAEPKPAGPQTSEPEIQENFKSWLSGRVERVIDCTETADSTDCWVELENGTLIKWAISMEDYPSVEASFKLGEDTVYLDDVTAGKIAREYYEKKREYDPKAWADCVLTIGTQFPKFMRRMEIEAINRATDQDIELSKLIAKEFGTT